MSRQEDILFCKIAVLNGLVTQEQAQKCLVVCNRREQESGRRPMVGAVFTKYNLLRTQEVQRIYTAVGKRLGTPAGAMRPPPPTRKRGGAPRGGAVTARREQKAARRVDPNTLWTGIGFGVVFLGVIAAMLVLWITNPGKTNETKASGDSPKVESPIQPAGGPRKSGTSPGVKQGEPKAVVKTEEMDHSFRNQLNQYMNDARITAFRDERPQDALRALKGFLNQNKHQFLSPEMDSRVKSLIAELEAQVAGGSVDNGSGEENSGLEN